MNNFEFEDWLGKQTDGKLRTIWDEIKPISGKLPNLKDFFHWMFGDDGYLNQLIKKVETEATGDFENKFLYPFFDDFEEKANRYNETERILIDRIMATIITNRVNLKSNGRSGIDEEKRKLFFKVWLYFSKEFNQNETKLPFRFIRQEYDITKPDSINWRLEPPLASWDVPELPKIDEEIFKSSSVSKFERIEQALIERKYLDKNLNWIGEKKDLAALIEVLYDKMFFRHNLTRLNLKKYFNKRYNTEIGQEFEPKRVSKNTIGKTIFSNLINSV